MDRISIADKLALIGAHWSPRIVAELNGQHVKLAKLMGTFTWHRHAQEDELFLVLRGHLTMHFRDRKVELHAGDMLVVPRGVEHLPVAEEETDVLLLEPAGTLNTGDAVDARRIDNPEWI